MKRLFAFWLGMMVVITVGAGVSQVFNGVITGPLNNQGAIQASYENFFLEVSKGNVPGHSIINKFGKAPDFDTGDGTVMLWDGADDSLAANAQAMTLSYSATADIDSVASSSGSDTGLISIQGINAFGSNCVQQVTLNGTTRVALDPVLFRAFRVKNLGTSDFVGNVSVYATNSAVISAGVPDGAALRARVIGAHNQTLMATFTVPTNTTAYLIGFYGGTAGGSRTSNYTYELYARTFGGVFRVQHDTALAETGTSHFNHPYQLFPSYSALTDLELRSATTEGAITAASVSGGFSLLLVEDGY